MSAPRTEAERLRRKLSRRMMRTVKDFDLIESGDRIMVAVSGGKDSYTLLDLLWRARRRSPFPFDVVAVHLDQMQPDYDGAPLKQWLEDYGAPYEILQRDTYSVVLELTGPGDTYCAPCSRMRRGILYKAAEELGCNKIALGHHRDDSLETFLMNLFFSGKMQAMPAGYTTNDGRFRVIRPLIECAEEQIAAYARELEFPILPCNLCGSQSGLQRDAMTRLLDRLQGDIPNVREVMLAALKNVRTSHLLDRELLDARVEADSTSDPSIGCAEPSDGETLPTLIQIG